MKNKLLLLLLISSSPVFCQDILWEKSLGGNHDDYLMDAQPTADYGFILAGSSLSNKTGNKTSNNNGDLDYWIWKMNETGDLDWQKNFGGSGIDLLQSITLTRDGGFLLAGNSSSNIGFDKKEDSKGQDDYWIIKLNAKGLEEWQKTIGGHEQEKIASVKQTSDGGYIIGGSSSSNLSGDKNQIAYGNLDYWVVKLDSEGKIQWQNTFGGEYLDELRSIEPTVDGGYIVGGYSNSSISGNKTSDAIGIGDYWVLKLDSKGTIEWQKAFGGNQDDELAIVHQTYDKGYIVAGNSNSEVGYTKMVNNENETDFWVLKLDEIGEIKWQQVYNFGKIDVLTSLVENEDHTFLLGGYAKGDSQKTENKKRKSKDGTDDYIAFKINEKGEEIWTKLVGSNGEDLLRKVVTTRDGGYLMAGTSNAYVVEELSGGSKKGLGKDLNGLQSDNQQIQNGIDEINSAITVSANEVNKTINDSATNATNKVKETLGITDNSLLKIGSPTAAIGGGGLLGNGSNSNNNASSTEKKLPASRDKKESYGSNDFWVVKLKDKSKPGVPKVTIEAYPNPSLGMTNIIIGYDFDKGTATVVDIAGRQLQEFEITTRTVPVDLSSYPEGIYIVNIKANGHNDGIKVIKGINKN